MKKQMGAVAACAMLIGLCVPGCKGGERGTSALASTSDSSSTSASVSISGSTTSSIPTGSAALTTTYRNAAALAQKDMTDNFWYGDLKTGHLVKEYHGLPIDESESQQMIWAHATAIFEMETCYRATGDEELKQRIALQWKFIKSAFNEEELTGLFGRAPNIAADDAGWGAMAYMVYYRMTNDEQALRCTGELVHNAYAYWAVDGNLSNGMYYNEDRTFASLASVGLMCAGLDFYRTAKDQEGFSELAQTVYEDTIRLYDWVEAKLRRDGPKTYGNGSITVQTADNLYWMGYDYASEGKDIQAPQGYNRPQDIHEAGSVSSLFGNMGMGIIHARLYALTGEEVYRKKAVETAQALTDSVCYNIRGAFINDRDAWANGSFVGDWVNEVLVLDGIRQEDCNIIRDTADSILLNCRTADGYYRAEWLGGSRWTAATATSDTPTTPQQIMTSANTVHFIMGAALAEKQELI